MKGQTIIQLLNRVAIDEELAPNHISLLMAVFYFSEPDAPYKSFQICRRKLMQFSRIRSKATYHKCLKKLIKLGLITYQPSYDPFTGSIMTIQYKKMATL